MRISRQGAKRISLLVVISLCTLLSCQGRSSAAMPAEVAIPNKPSVSTSGKFILVVLTQNADGNDTQSFQILAQDKTTLYTSAEQFSTRDTNFFLWDAQDRVWAYSGDLGTF